MGIEFFDPENVYVIFSNKNYETRRHMHYMLEIVCSRQGTFTVITDQRTYSGLQSVIIPPNLPHHFNCIGADCDLLFLDPLSPLGLYFMHYYNLTAKKDILCNIDGSELYHQNGCFNMAGMLRNIESDPMFIPDTRISRCIDAIALYFSEPDLTISDLSAVSFLSEGRLTHLFKEQMGVSVHQYILWKRVIFAVIRSRGGASLTECAHAAGFSDSAHFSKAFVKMFGIKPFFVLKS